MNQIILPHVLVIDDLLGRTHPNRRNEERSSFCGQFLLEDVSGDQTVDQAISSPIGTAVLCRGQFPVCADVGDRVDNDLEGTLRTVHSGWDEPMALDHLSLRSRWSLVLLDLCFHTGAVTRESDRKIRGAPEGGRTDNDPEQYFGLRILDRLYQSMPELPVVLLSSTPRTKRLAERFVALGAVGFLPKDDPLGVEKLQQLLWEHALTADQTGNVIGRSRPLLFALRAARQCSKHRRPILIRGERGTGKELFADYIHNSGRRATPLVKVNCANFSSSLYSAELFGHEAGAFTDARKSRSGLIRAANGGTLFFDEIALMPPEVQGGMLRFFQEQEFRAIGAERSQHVDVRVISATNSDIEALALAGQGFREDLLDRMRAGGVVVLPALRDRKEDIPLLAEIFVRHAELEIPGTMRRTIRESALEKLVEHSWPGNIRELMGCIYQAVQTHRHIEYLDPIHIRFQREPHSSHRVADEERLRSEAVRMPEDLIRVLVQFRWASVDSSALAGKLPAMREALARALIGYLDAALNATSKRTPANPEGDVQFHPALKLMEGDSTLSATAAADTVLRLLKIAPEHLSEFLKQSHVRQAYERALRLRQKRKLKER